MKARNLLTRLAPLLFVGGLGCLYLDAFILPHTPIYQGDTAPIYLLEAQKMLEGQVIYRDFFQFTLPGTQVFYLTLFKLFGVRAWIPSATWVLLGICLAWLLVLISRRVLSGAYVYLPSLLFLGFGYVTERDPTHHWFSTLACMVAIAVLMARRSPPRLAAAGVLCGLATLFSQSRGVVAVLGIAAFLLWEFHVKKQSSRWLIKAALYLFLGFLVTTLPPMAYLAWKVGLGQFITCTVVFLMKYWSQWYWGTFYVYMANPPDFPLLLELPALLVWFFIHFLVPFGYVLFLVHYHRRARAHPDEPWDCLMLVNIVGIFLFLGIAFSPVWFRLISVAAPGLILFAWLIKSSPRFPRPLTHFVWIFALVVLISQSVITQVDWKGFLDTPTGRAALLDRDRYEKYLWILRHTHAGDFYFQSDDCDQYFLLGLRNPAQVSFVTDSTYTRPEQEQNVIAMLEKHQVQIVMWSAGLDVPTTPGSDGSEEAPLRAYLKAHYHYVKGFDDKCEEAWVRTR